MSTTCHHAQRKHTHHATATHATATGSAASVRILLRLPNWLGDSVMSSPTLEWLKNAYPSATFTLVGSKAACGIYERDPRIERIIIDESKGDKGGKGKGDKGRGGLGALFSRIKATYRLARDIGQHDISIALTNNFFSALLLYLTKSPVRIGYARECRSPLLTHVLKLERHRQDTGEKLHQVQLYLRLLSPLPEVKELYRIFTQAQHYSASDKGTGGKGKTSSLLDFLSTQDLCLKVGKNSMVGLDTIPRDCDNVAARSCTAEMNSACAPEALRGAAHSAPHNVAAAPCKSVRIGINPGAAFGSAKRWEQGYFIACVEHFLSQGHAVYLFGSSSESSANADIARAIASHPNAECFHDLTDRTSLSSLIDTIGDLSVFITNDSGPMHIASALKVPLVAIFGPTDVGETAPYEPRTDSQNSESKPQILLYKALPCSPCKKRECPLTEPEAHHQCMKSITPNEVIEAAHSLLHSLPHEHSQPSLDSEFSESSQSHPHKGDI